MPQNPCCCGFNCELFTDAFDRAEVGDDWSVASGTWAIDAGVLKSANANASICIVSTAQRMASMSNAIVLTVKVTGGANAVLTVHTSATDYVTFTCNAAGNIVSIAFNTGTPVAVSAVASNTYIICHLRDEWVIVSNVLTDTPTAEPDSEAICFGYGATAAGSFDDVHLQHHSSIDDTCPDCGEALCGSCTGSGIRYYEVEITGVVAGDTCTLGQCSDVWNHSFVCAFSAGGSTCYFQYWFTMPAGSCTGTGTSYVELSLSSGIYNWEVDLYDGSGPALWCVFRKTFDGKQPCDTDGWMEVPRDVRVNDTTKCNATNATCRVRSI